MFARNSLESRARRHSLGFSPPTFLIAFTIALLLATRTDSTLMLPPSAVLSFATAASVTSSFVWDDSMSDIRVAKRRFYCS